MNLLIKLIVQSCINKRDYYYLIPMYIYVPGLCTPPPPLCCQIDYTYYLKLVSKMKRNFIYITIIFTRYFFHPFTQALINVNIYLDFKESVIVFDYLPWEYPCDFYQPITLHVWYIGVFSVFLLKRNI